MTVMYRVYGLDLSVNETIPGLVNVPNEMESDVQIRLGFMPPWIRDSQITDQEQWYISDDRDDYGDPILSVWKLFGGTYFRLEYSDGTEFLVDREGTQIWSTWPDQLTLEDTITYLLGPVLGFVLRLRGKTCLHASAITVGTQAIAMMGQAGAGKSTTAAAFAGIGHTVLADDIVVLSDQEQLLMVHPAYPRIRLWPESVTALYGSPEVLPRLTPTWNKRYLDLTENGHRFQSQPLPLAAVYFLRARTHNSGAPFVEPISSPHAALIALVANTYGNYLLEEEMRTQQFAVLSKVVANVPLRRVIPNADPARLSRLCDVILDDFRKL